MDTCSEEGYRALRDGIICLLRTKEALWPHQILSLDLEDVERSNSHVRL